MKSFIISDNEVTKLADIQVAFKVFRDGSVEIKQVEVYSQYMVEWLMLDLSKMTERQIDDLKEICTKWYEATNWKRKEYNNDDPDFAA